MRNFAMNWWQNIVSHKDDIAYKFTTTDKGIETITYNEWGKDLQRLSVGLMEHGFEPETRMGFVAQNCKAWTDLAVATWFVGGCVSAIMPGKTRRESLRSLARSGCEWIVVKDMAGLEAFDYDSGDLPGHLKWIVLQDQGVPDKDNLLTMPKLRESGRYRLLRGGDKQLGQRMYAQKWDTPALIAFDPEGYDEPFGAYFSGQQIANHLAHVSQDAAWDQASLAAIASYSMIESFTLTMAILWSGQTLITGDSLGDVVSELHALAPTHLLVNDGYLKGRSKQWKARLENAPEFLKRLADTDEQDKSSVVRLLSGLSERAAQNALFDHIRNDLGDALKAIYLIDGLAPDDIEDILKMVDIDVLGIWGTAETGLSHMTRPDARQAGGVGRPLEGYACKLNNTKGDEPGEVLIKGQDVCLGYWHDTQTPHLDEHGWFHTGQQGELTTGHLRLIQNDG